LAAANNTELGIYVLSNMLKAVMWPIIWPASRLVNTFPCAQSIVAGVDVSSSLGSVLSFVFFIQTTRRQAH